MGDEPAAAQDKPAVLIIGGLGENMPSLLLNSTFLKFESRAN